MLISPTEEVEHFAFKLEFKNMNNTTKFEVFLLKIISMKERGIKILKIHGDVELIVCQIKGQYSVKNHKLKNYRNRVWDEIEELDAFSIKLVLREMNSKENLLAVSTSLLLHHLEFKDKKY